jgi:Fe-S-cluster containining protein
MIVIQDVLISEEIIEEKFLCDLSVCKGACCTEGDYGAPVTNKEMEEIHSYLEIIKENLPFESRQKMEIDGSGFTFYPKPNIWGTTCHNSGACIFLTKNELGISLCGIEKTWHEKKIPFRKPISCHLYPIRISKNDIVGFEAWNYDQWDICSAACAKGEKEKLALFEFAKEAIIRAKGQDFYDELQAYVDHINEKKVSL